MDPLKAAVLGRSRERALVEGARAWTYAELDAAADDMAVRLRALGAGRGERVVLLTPTRAEAVVAIHAVPRTGAAVAPLHPGLTVPELRRAVSALRPAAILCDATTGQVATELAEGRVARRPVVTVDRTGSSLLMIDDVEPTFRGGLVEPAEDDVVAVLWTSGTGGSPRGVEIRAQGLEASAVGTQARLGLGPADSWYASLRLAHVGGIALVHRAAVVGCRVVVTAGFSADELNELIDAGQVSHASLVPTMLAMVLEARGDRICPATFRCLLVGGAPAPLSLVERAQRLGFPVALTYGMTEATSQIATAPPGLVRAKPGTVGSPLPGIDVRTAPDGEILARGPTVARGFVGKAGSPVDDDGWLHTGDLGRIDAEGHLWITGRRSDRIISGGINVDPREVEDALRLHSDVEDVAVVGLPDPEWGERVAAAVVLRLGGTPSRAAFDAFLAERLSVAKRPRQVAFVGLLPRNPNGKVDRAKVSELFTGKSKLR